MESSNRDLSSGPESRPPLGNEQQDTMENGCEAASASSVGGTSETGVEKVVFLPIPYDISVCYKDEF